MLTATQAAHEALASELPGALLVGAKNPEVPMPHYYFNLRLPDGQLEQDEVGVSFPDLDAAHEEAIVAARQIMADELLAGHKLTERCFEIADATGEVLLLMPFKDALYD